MSRVSVARLPANPANPIYLSHRSRLRMNMQRQKLSGLERYGRMTRRAQFLADMDWMVPWARMAEQVQPYCAQLEGEDAPAPRWLERMLRIHFLQLWFNLSDLAVEESLYDSAAMREFAGIDLVVEAAPDATVIGRFRDLLQRKRLEKKLASQVTEQLRRSGIQIENGTIVDATTIGMPSSARVKQA
jgi:IS5 family transposase